MSCMNLEVDLQSVRSEEKSYSLLNNIPGACCVVFLTYLNLWDYYSSHSLGQLAGQAVADSGTTTTTTQVLSV